MKKITSSSLSEAVYEKLKAMIIAGDLVPGAKISKKELAQALSVSITPINDAIARLAGERLVMADPDQGLLVRSFDDQSLADIYALRAGIEGIAVRLCVAEGSDEDLTRLLGFFTAYSLPIPPSQTREYMEEDKSFHKTILEIARIPLLVDMEGFYGHMAKSYHHGLMRPPSDTLDEHRAIIAAVRTRDAKLAGDLMISHHLASRNRLLHRQRQGS